MKLLLISLLIFSFCANAFSLPLILKTTKQVKANGARGGRPEKEIK